MTASGTDGGRLGRLMAHPAFVRFLAARLAVSIAVQMQTVAVGWQIYSITRDPLDLGLIGLSQFLPFVLLVCRRATAPTGAIARQTSVCSHSTAGALLCSSFTRRGSRSPGRCSR